MKIIEKDGYKRSAIIVKCNTCEKTFKKATRHIKRRPNSKHYCSIKCSSIGSRNRTLLTCANCKKQFTRKKSHLLSKSGLYFCCRKCKDEAQRIGGPIKLSHYGNGESDYRKTAFETYANKCAICNYDKYKSVLEVHHIDGNRENNSKENLIILCANCHRSITLGYYELPKN